MGVYAFYYIGLPYLLNLEDISPIISRYIKNEYGFNVDIKNPRFKMGYLPSVWIKADYFNILNDDKSKAMSIDKPVLKVSVFPLIIGRVNLKYFSANDIYIDLYCDDKLRIHLGQYLLLKMSNFVINISGSRVYINKFLISLNDNIKNNKIDIVGKYFNIDRYDKNKFLKTSFNFDIKSFNKVSSVYANIDTKLPFKSHIDDYPPEIAVSAANIDFSEFVNFIKYLSHGEIYDISGNFSLDVHSDKAILGKKQYVSDMLLDKFSIKTKIFEKDYSYPYKVYFNASYLLEKDNLTVDSIKLSTPKFSLLLSGAVKKVASKNPVPDLRLKMKNIKSQDLLEILPFCNKFDKMTKIYVSVIKYAGFFSNVNVDLKITDNFKRPLLFGEINLTDAYVTRPIKNAPKNADINIEYIGDKLELSVDVPTALNQAVKVRGVIDAYGDNNADLHITSTPLIDLSEAERILMPVHKAFDFLLGPVPIMSFSGYGSIDLIVKGTKKDPHTFGWFKTVRATTFFDDIPNLILTNADSTLIFDDVNTKFSLQEGLVNGKNINIDGTCNLKGDFNFNAKMPAQTSEFLLNVLKTSPMLKDISQIANIIQKTEGIADLIINLSGHLPDINDLKIGENVHAKGEINLHSVKAKIVDLKGHMQNIYGTIKFKDFDVNFNLASALGASKVHLSGDILNNFAKINFNSNNLRLYDVLNSIDVSDFVHDNSSGADLSQINLSGKYNGPVSKIDLKGVTADGVVTFKNCNLLYKPYKMPVKIPNGRIQIDKNSLTITKLNAIIGTMPLVLSGKVNNFIEKPLFDLSLFAKPNQKFVDYVYNSKVLYPVKMKGNILLSGVLSGIIDKMNINGALKLDKNSSIYYMGASVESDINPILFLLNATVEPDKINIKKFNYDKIAFNGTALRQLSAAGQLSLKNNITYFNNLKILTSVPTDMKIFNILFKKPFIKNGMFTSNLILNGSSVEPAIRGYLNLFEIVIPVLDASIKNISLKFLQNTILANIAGTAFENTFKLDIDAANKFRPPYIVNNAKIDAGKLNIDTLYDAINDYSIEMVNSTYNDNFNNFDLNDLQVKNLTMIAEEVIVNKSLAKNLSANLSLNNGNLKVDRFKFNLAKGKMDGYVSYNIRSKSSAFDLNVDDVDANDLAKSLLDLDGQIYGLLDGQISLNCTGDNQTECLKNLSGRITFRVKDGKMPKLGSLEYLLKAGNLLKSGITGLSVNSIVELIIPLKTGNFDQIKGSIDINEGIADKIQIISDSKDLNLFIIGEYDLSSKFADMYVFGRLSKNISTLLGPVGNLSLNTLFNTIPGVNLSSSSDTGLVSSINKIPGLELSNKLFRVFAAEIHGDISGDDYVESFKWIE